MTVWHWIVFVLTAISVIMIAVCVPLQYRALNRVAANRSIFISGMSILMGLIVGMYPSIAATVISLLLILLGLAFILFMGVKSFQRLQMVKQTGK